VPVGRSLTEDFSREMHAQPDKAEWLWREKEKQRSGEFVIIEKGVPTKPLGFEGERSNRGTESFAHLCGKRFSGASCDVGV